MVVGLCSGLSSLTKADELSQRHLPMTIGFGGNQPRALVRHERLRQAAIVFEGPEIDPRSADWLQCKPFTLNWKIPTKNAKAEAELLRQVVHMPRQGPHRTCELAVHPLQRFEDDSSLVLP